jgi:alpha,alpha-trehalose phosphorylase
VIAAEVGHLELAYDFGEAALVDLGRNTRDAVHIASLAGAWLAAVAGFGGMRDHDGNLTFAPGCRPGSNGSPSASSSEADDSRSSSIGTRRPTRC